MDEEKPKLKRVSYYGADAREKILKGVDAVANAVKVTMGAKGRTVFTSYGHATKDGVTVARDVELFDDPAAAKGARLVKSASVKTCDVAGDGTTVTCVLTQSLIHEGLRLISEGKDAQSLKKEIDEVAPVVLKALEDQAVKVEDIRQIAEVSANDKDIGGVVAEAVMAVGVDGMVTVESTYGEREVEVVEGMQFDRGVPYSSFYTEPQRRRTAYEDVSVIIYSGKLHDHVSFGKAMAPLVSEGKPMLIIADDYEVMAMRMMELSKIQAGVKILPVKSPVIYHDEALKDIAIYCGATVITESDGFKNFKREWVGHVKSVVSTNEKTVLRCDDDKQEAIKTRVAEIYEEAKNFTDSERKNREKRASRIQGKIAVIKLPVTTEEEGREQKDRVEDAIYASQAALEAGIVPGGGLAFLRAQNSISSSTDGAEVVKKSLEMPLRQIVRNAGKNESDILLTCKAENKGYNVLTDQFEDLSSTGIVDPVKVCLTAFKNAISVAGIALTTEVIISEE
jgi:chaperonin GroEL